MIGALTLATVLFLSAILAGLGSLLAWGEAPERALLITSVLLTGGGVCLTIAGWAGGAS